MGVITIKNISVLSGDVEFLKRLLTFRSYDDVQKSFLHKGVNISLEDIDKLKKIVHDLEENEDIMTESDLTTIRDAAKSGDINGYFNQDLYDLEDRSLVLLSSALVRR